MHIFAAGPSAPPPSPRRLAHLPPARPVGLQRRPQGFASGCSCEGRPDFAGGVPLGTRPGFLATVTVVLRFSFPPGRDVGPGRSSPTPSPPCSVRRSGRWSRALHHGGPSFPLAGGLPRDPGRVPRRAPAGLTALVAAGIPGIITGEPKQPRMMAGQD